MANQPRAEAEPFRWLPTGATALEAMLEAVRRATRSLRLEVYIYADDAVGERFRAALCEARERGVRVQVMLDAVGSMLLSNRFWMPLVEAGGEFRWFNPFQTAERYGCRNHRKLLVVDDEVAYIGGFNISEDYDGDGVNHGWRDLGMELRGPVVMALAATFDELFTRADQPLPALLPLRKRPDTEVHGEEWSLLLSGPGRGHHALRRALIRDLAKACHVRMICAYFVPTSRIRRELRKVVRRGGRVQLILAGKSDVPLSHMATRSLYSRLLAAGVEIYEYEPQVLHAKLFAIDDVVYVGSANLDARSLKLNYELLLRVDQHEVAEEAGALFEADLKRSRRLELRGWKASRSFWQRMIGRLAYFMLVRVDPFLTRLTWHDRAVKAVERLGPEREGRATSSGS